MAEGRRKRNLTELTGNELTVQNTKHVKSVEESANSIVGEQKGVVSNVKHAALGTSKRNTVANTMQRLRLCGESISKTSKKTTANKFTSPNSVTTAPEDQDTSSSMTITSSNDIVKWVQCCLCKKWRVLPIYVNMTRLPKKWVCLMNTFDSEHQSCEAEEEGKQNVSIADEIILEQEDNISDDTLLNIVIDYPKSGNNHSVREVKPKGLESVKTQISQPRDKLIRDSGHQEEAKRLQYLMELESVKSQISQLRDKLIRDPGRPFSCQEEAKLLQQSIGNICRVLYLLNNKGKTQKQVAK
jgi:hypothetical protein